MQASGWRTEVERLAKLDWNELVGEAAQNLSGAAGFQAELTRRQVMAIEALTKATDRAARGAFGLTLVLVVLTAVLVLLTWRLAAK